MTEKSKVPGVYCHVVLYVYPPRTYVRPCTHSVNSNLQHDTILGLGDGKGSGLVLKQQMM